jgi:hypothetical protein
MPLTWRPGKNAFEQPHCSRRTRAYSPVAQSRCRWSANSAARGFGQPRHCTSQAHVPPLSNHPLVTHDYIKLSIKVIYISITNYHHLSSNGVICPSSNEQRTVILKGENKTNNALLDARGESGTGRSLHRARHFFRGSTTDRPDCHGSSSSPPVGADSRGARPEFCLGTRSLGLVSRRLGLGGRQLYAPATSGSRMGGRQLEPARVRLRMEWRLLALTVARDSGPRRHSRNSTLNSQLPAPPPLPLLPPL